MFVILFDIDGTLISNSISKQSEERRFAEAIRDVVGRAPVLTLRKASRFPDRFSGMVDPQISRILLNQMGLSEEDVKCSLPRVIARMGERYKRLEKQIVLNKGVEPLLRLSDQVPNITSSEWSQETFWKWAARNYQSPGSDLYFSREVLWVRKVF